MTADYKEYSILKLIESDGYFLNDEQKYLCVELLSGKISKDEYLKKIFRENMNLLWQNITV